MWRVLSDCVIFDWCRNHIFLAFPSHNRDQNPEKEDDSDFGIGGSALNRAPFRLLGGVAQHDDHQKKGIPLDTTD